VSVGDELDSVHLVDRGVMLVTGGSRGIGAEVCRRAASAGWTVCLTYRDNAAAAAAVVADIEGLGGRASAVQADVGVEADVVAAFAVADKLGPLTSVVANAGVVGTKTRVDQLDADRIARMLAVNVAGQILTCREAVRRLSTIHGGSGGSIVLVSSAASRLGSPGEYVDYAASKGAIDTLGIGLSKEVASEGIRVNVVRPGVIDTEIHASGGQPDRVERLAASLPLGRAGTTSEVAGAILWLSGNEASYCTGSILDVAGGR
jgi:NAD(P)-dependent dehydrogenase (short-subunit alcohol dehydrogenase family)